MTNWAMTDNLRFVDQPTWIDVCQGPLVIATIEVDEEGWRVDYPLLELKGGPFKTWNEAVSWLCEVNR